MGSGLCAIYACDVLSFLRFPQLKRCRLVSHAYNHTVVTNPRRLPARRQMSQMLISVEEVGSTSYTQEGYVVGEENSMAWLQADPQGCCKEELEETGRSLAGELIFCDRSSSDHVKILFTGGFVKFSARNELSSETAFGLLHLFEHLRYTYFSMILIVNNSNSARQINQAIFRPLSRRGERYEFHARRMYGPDWLDGMPLRIGESKWSNTVLTLGMKRLMEFGLRARRQCSRIFFQLVRVEGVEALLQHLESTLPRIGPDVVQNWLLHLDHNILVRLDDIPAWITDGMERKDDMWMVLYSRRFINQRSGEQFNVVVKCVRCERHAAVTEVILNF